MLNKIKLLYFPNKCNKYNLFRDPERASKDIRIMSMLIYIKYDNKQFE